LKNQAIIGFSRMTSHVSYRHRHKIPNEAKTNVGTLYDIMLKCLSLRRQRYFECSEDYPQDALRQNAGKLTPGFSVPMVPMPKISEYVKDILQYVIHDASKPVSSVATPTTPTPTLCVEKRKKSF
jgi:hypothetical protein